MKGRRYRLPPSLDGIQSRSALTSCLTDSTKTASGSGEGSDTVSWTQLIPGTHYTVTEEVVGGWALMQFDTLEEAIEGQQAFADLHAKYWPECEMVATMRQISEGPDPDAAS